jgi:hypothetical protein
MTLERNILRYSDEPPDYGGRNAFHHAMPCSPQNWNFREPERGEAERW